ncbi:hypothetical protein HERIO_962 [Hepatospora eriocheir]|uniref:Uncharacterized protein n=1 Tax=Hepatospora eriocheir TaxID=1081669 RepID=A0A1X0QBR9_9MICR|nr:hypothetical protein HERIO_962 [Hepatospora eriocheir]
MFKGDQLKNFQDYISPTDKSTKSPVRRILSESKNRLNIFLNKLSKYYSNKPMKEKSNNAYINLNLKRPTTFASLEQFSDNYDENRPFN